MKKKKTLQGPAQFHASVLQDNAKELIRLTQQFTHDNGPDNPEPDDDTTREIFECGVRLAAAARNFKIVSR